MEFWVDFNGYLKIKAENQQEAENKFWSWVNSITAIGDCSDDVWDVENIEPVKYENPEDLH